jgi:WXG100 protein secretion system (Wss), protein YukD
VKGRRIRLVTVVGPAGRRDLALAGEASLVFLLPVLVDLVGDAGAERTSPRWALYTAEGAVLPRTRSLLAAGVVDGDVVELSREGLGATRRTGAHA